MPLPEFQRRSYAGGCQATQLLSPMDDTDLSFTITGNFANYPTGDEGCFAMSVDDGLSTVEKILCQTLDVSTGIITVCSEADGSTGRGYDGTPANAHVPLTAPSPQVRPCWTATEAAEANLAVAYVLGSLGGNAPATGEVFTWTSAGHPQWQVPGAAANLMPIGGMCLWGAAAAPTNWHLCDHSALSRSTYSALFAVLGTLWGAGDGSTTFNLPDLRNKFPIGASSILALAASGGSQSISASNMPAHTHALDAPNYVVIETFSASSLGLAAPGDASATYHTGPTGSTGGGTPYLPPAAGVNFIIRIL